MTKRHMTNKERIFALEDDGDISQLIKQSLEASGFEVHAFSNTTNIISKAEQLKPNLFLLDIMVPGSSGTDVCQRIRRHPALAKTPVIFLTAKAAEQERISGLELGADDYITKPFSPREMVARVKAVLRRFERPFGPAVIEIGRLRIDSAAMIISIRNHPVTATATEFRLLDFFARNPGQVFSRDQILDAVWRDTQFVTPRSVDVYVRKLREKIEENPEDPVYLRTVRGAGYRFEAPRG